VAAAEASQRDATPEQRHRAADVRERAVVDLRDVSHVDDETGASRGDEIVAKRPRGRHVELPGEPELDRAGVQVGVGHGSTRRSVSWRARVDWEARA
jgi:hypothetical protein